MAEVADEALCLTPTEWEDMSVIARNFLAHSEWATRPREPGVSAEYVARTLRQRDLCERIVSAGEK